MDFLANPLVCEFYAPNNNKFVLVIFYIENSHQQQISGILCTTLLATYHQRNVSPALNCDFVQL